MASTAYITVTPGYSSQIGHLVSMMNYTRAVTLQLIEGLGVDELDYIHDDMSNSIGALLIHMAAIERAQQIWSFKDRGFTDSEREELELPMKLGSRARSVICGKEIGEYIAHLSEVRGRTFEELKKCDDSWLYQEIPGKFTNQYCRWFHVIEDEISHRGQIKWLLSRIRQLQAK